VSYHHQSIIDSHTSDDDEASKQASKHSSNKRTLGARISSSDKRDKGRFPAIFGGLKGVFDATTDSSFHDCFIGLIMFCCRRRKSGEQKISYSLSIGVQQSRQNGDGREKYKLAS